MKVIDKWNLVHTIFFEYHGGPKKDEITIIPLEIDIMFFAGLRQGIGSRFGPNQELAFEWLWPFKIEM